MKLFFANDLVGVANGMIRPAKVLQRRGHEVRTFAIKDSPAYKAFFASGLQPLTPERLDLDVMENILRSERPDAVLTGTPDYVTSTETLALKAAIKLGIPTAAFVEALVGCGTWIKLSGERDFPLYRNVTRLLVSNPLAKNLLIREGFGAEAIVVTGNPAHEDFAVLRPWGRCIGKGVREEMGIPSDAVVFHWAVTWWLDRPSKDTSEWFGYEEEELLREFLEGVSYAALRFPGRRIQALIRQKYAWDFKRLREIVAEYPVAKIVDSSNDCGYDLKGAIFASDLVAGRYTLVLSEAAALGLPVASYMPGCAETDPQPSSHLRVVKPIYEKGALADLILRAAEDPHALSDVRKEMQEVEIVENATANFAMALLNIK